jgi:hypothetical protein
MEAVIRFKNGEMIRAEQNGNCFIVPEVPEFPEDLSEVTVLADDKETVMHYVMIEEAASVDGRFWFCMVEESAEDRQIREQAERIRFLEDCLMEISEEVYK